MRKYGLFVPTRYIQRRKIYDAHKLLWEGVVGLEIHAQIQTNSKLFSGAGTKFAELVNNQVSLFDAALPGTLPVLNKECVKKGILTALALNCNVHETSSFDRKHYFYADLPAGYQITQQRFPFATNGSLEFHCRKSTVQKKSFLKKTKIKQIQLEQDSGKSLHDSSTNQSLVDLNRAGNPLMEIIFEPDLQDGDEAASLVNELILILKKLETCSCKIEEGALRVDANVSVRPKGSTSLGTRTEVKNIGGVNNILKAVDFEIQRQTRLRKYGKQVVNETRAWDATRNITVAMRDKEVQQDYRFMPEPNLLPLRVQLNENNESSDVINVATLKKLLPELPAAYRTRLCETYKLEADLILRLLVEPKLLDYFIFIMEDNPERNPTKVSNALLNDVLAAVYRINVKSDDCKMDIRHFAELYHLLSEQIINRVIFQRVLNIIINGSNKSPNQIVDEEKWYQIDELNILEESCRLTIEFNPELVEEYHKTKKLVKQKNFQKLFTEALQHTHGRSNLKLLKEILERLLNTEKKSN